MKSRVFSCLLRKSGIFSAVFGMAVLPLRAADPAAVLPDESVAYLEVDSAALYKLESHPVVKAVPFDELKKIVYKLVDAAPDHDEQAKKLLAEETGVPYEELLKKTGRFAVSLHDLKIPANPAPDNVGVEISIAQEFDADEAFADKYFRALAKLIGQELGRKSNSGGEQIQKHLAKVAELLERSAVEHAGAKIHVFKLKETDETKRAPAFVREWAYAVHDKMILASSGLDQVKEMIDRMKSGGDTGSLAASAFYKLDHGKAGKALVMGSLNLEIILELVEKHALPHADTGDLDAEKLWTGLGADKLNSAAFALSAGAETLDLAGFLTYNEKPGLLAMLAIPGPGTAPSFFPKGLAQASYQQIDINKTFENFEKLAGEIYPAAGPALTKGLEAVKEQTGVDLRKEIISQLGPDLWIVSSAVKDPENAEKGSGQFPSFTGLVLGGALYGVRLKDSKTAAAALKKLIDKATQGNDAFEKQEFEGFTINRMKNLPAEIRAGYVITDDWLILNLNDQPALEQLLSRLAKKADDGFFARQDIAPHLAAMRDGQAVTSGTDIGNTLKGLCILFGSIVDKDGPPDAKAIPFDRLVKLLDVPLISVDKGWIDAKHAEYRLRIAPKGK